MKQLLLILTLLAGNAFGQPFLVCDPYPASVDQPVSFTITGLASGAPVTSAAVTNPDGSVQLHLDLSNPPLANATYNVSVTATDVFGHVSTASTLTFTVGVPGAPGHLKVSQN